MDRSNLTPSGHRSNTEPIELDTFDALTTELCVIFDNISRVRLSYGRGVIGRGEYRQETRKLYQRAHKLMPAWERAGEAKGEL